MRVICIVRSALRVICIVSSAVRVICFALSAVRVMCIALSAVRVICIVRSAVRVICIVCSVVRVVCIVRSAVPVICIVCSGVRVIYIAFSAVRVICIVRAAVRVICIVHSAVRVIYIALNFDFDLRNQSFCWYAYFQRLEVTVCVNYHFQKGTNWYAYVRITVLVVIALGFAVGSYVCLVLCYTPKCERITSVQFSSVQIRMVNMSSEKPICAPSRLSEVCPTLPLKHFHCSSVWQWPSLVLSRSDVLCIDLIHTKIT